MDCTIAGAIKFIQKRAAESLEKNEVLEAVGRYYAIAMLTAVLGDCEPANREQYREDIVKVMAILKELLPRVKATIVPVPECPPTQMLEEYTKNLASEIAKAVEKIPEPPLPAPSVPAAPAAPPAPGVPGGADKQEWDNLPKTLEGEDNPQLKPYPRWEYDPSKKDWRQVPDPQAITTFDDIAGQEAAKRKIQEALVRPFLFPNLYTNRTKQKAFMWYGVPGTGKTTLAEAAVLAIRTPAKEPIYRTAAEVAALDRNPYIGDRKGVQGFRKTFYPDKKKVPKVIMFNAGISDLESKYKGEGERKMARFFQIAVETSPSIIFFDEADAYLDPSKELNAGIITTFKQEQGGFGAKTRDVVTILATNYPTRIEGAILSRVAGGDIEIGIPDQAARAQIVVNSIQKMLRVPVFSEKGEAELKGFAEKVGILTAPPNWKEDPANVAKFSAVNFPGPLGAQAFAKAEAAKNVYSGRDVFNMSKEMAQKALERVAKGKVRKCTRKEVDQVCKSYRDWYIKQDFDPANLWIYAPEGEAIPPGAIVKQTEELTQAERVNVVQTNIIWDDVLGAFIEFKPTVTMADIFEQMKFNETRGDMGRDSLSLWWQDKLAKSPPAGKYATQGANHTVPPN